MQEPTLWLRLRTSRSSLCREKTLLGLDAQYRFNKDPTAGATILHFSEKAFDGEGQHSDEVINTPWD